MGQSVCTQTAHRVPTTEIVSEKEIFWKTSGVCHMYVHILSHYTGISWPSVGNYHVYMSYEYMIYQKSFTGGQENPAFWPLFVFWSKNMDIFGIFKNHLMSRFDISSWSRAKKLLKPFLDSPRVGGNKNNPFETSKVFADMGHNFEHFIIFIFSFPKFYLMWEVFLVSANTFDVSNRF